MCANASRTRALGDLTRTDSPIRRIGMYFHIYGHTVPAAYALHLHLVDLEHTGPTFDALGYKNLPLQSVAPSRSNSISALELVYPMPQTR